MLSLVWRQIATTSRPTPSAPAVGHRFEHQPSKMMLNQRSWIGRAGMFRALIPECRPFDPCELGRLPPLPAAARTNRLTTALPMNLPKAQAMQLGVRTHNRLLA